MSDDNFVTRWSRLKRESAQRQGAPAEAEAPDERPSVAREDGAAASADQARKPEPDAELDLASLPSIDSIVAGSDIRAFLQKGVPAELTKAALRRAWTSDPAIRDFIGLAENQWDFTDPASIPGFGALRAGDDVGQLVAQAMGKWPPDAPPEVASAVPPNAPPNAPDAVGQEPGAASELARPHAAPLPDAAGHDKAAAQAETPMEVAAAQHSEPEDSDPGQRRKGHGRALPR